MSDDILSRHLLIPNLEFSKDPKTLRTRVFECHPVKLLTTCLRCINSKVYVHQHSKRVVKDIISDHEGSHSQLYIKVTRYRCACCKKTFTPTIPGINVRAKTTERLRRKILWACDNFADLKKVKQHYKLSHASIDMHYYKALQNKIQHQVNKPWPEVIGIDEHAFSKNKEFGYRNFVTMVVDHQRKKPFELLPCRDKKTLTQMTKHIKGVQRVKIVTMDLSSTYKSFLKGGKKKS